MKKIILFLFVLCAYNAQSQTICVGKVKTILDGDRLVVVCKEKEYKVKLAEIESPKNGGDKCAAQPFGDHARIYLEKWLLQEKVRIVSTDELSEGFLGAKVYVPGMNARFDPDKNVSHQLVQEGYAHVYRSTDSKLHSMQRQAQQQKIGVWSLPKRCMMAPWEWEKVKNKCEIQSQWKRMRCYQTS